MKTYVGTMIGFFFVVSFVGCGGGGGGTGGGPFTLTSWSSIVPPETVEVNGISKDATYQPNAESSPALVFADRPVRDSSVTLTFASDGSLEKIVATTPDLVKTWDTTTSAPDTISDTSEWIYAIDDIQSDIAIISNPVHTDSNPANTGSGWEYQTFGAWESGRGFDAGTVGGISIGAKTPADAIPAEGIVRFEGNTSGFFVDAEGTDFHTRSTLVADVYFLAAGGNQISISSTDTQRMTVDNLLNESPPVTFTPDQNLDWSSGLVEYSSVSRGFRVSIVSDEDYGMTGDTTFQFYGPAADELGGIFSLSVPPTTSEPISTMHYYGAYGAAPVEIP